MTFVRSSDCLIYRTDLFEAAGYSAPFKSWDEFIEACQAVTQDTDGDGVTDVWASVSSSVLKSPSVMCICPPSWNCRATCWTKTVSPFGILMRREEYGTGHRYGY